MFDAKSLLEAVVRGAAPAGPSTSTPTQQPNGSSSIGDILNEILRSAGGGSNPQGGAQSAPSGSGGVGDILNQISRSLSQGQARSPGDAPAQTGTQSGDAGADLGTILSQIRDKLGQAGGSVSASGGIGDILGRVLAQATQGVKEGSARIGQETGASDALGRLASDPQTGQLLGKLKDLIQNNPYASSAAAGGLGGLLLGTRTGRSVAASSAKLGALAMLGGLAYKALQNYEAGKPLLTGDESADKNSADRTGAPQAAISPEPAPAGSGFEPAAMTNDAAVHYLQAMIAAAFADGRIDPSEQERIMGGIKQSGLDGEAEAFLASELNDPPTIEELAQSVSTPQEAVQLYIAARIAVADNSPAEERFLASLANALRLDPKLTAQIDATARQAAA